jgi:hypothetical protein
LDKGANSIKSRPSAQALQTFDSLWPKYRRELQLNADAATMIADEVQQV